MCSIILVTAKLQGKECTSDSGNIFCIYFEMDFSQGLVQRSFDAL